MSFGTNFNRYAYSSTDVGVSAVVEVTHVRGRPTRTFDLLAGVLCPREMRWLKLISSVSHTGEPVLKPHRRCRFTRYICYAQYQQTSISVPDLVRVIRFIINRKYAFFCIYWVRFSTDKNNHYPLDYYLPCHVAKHSTSIKRCQVDRRHI